MNLTIGSTDPINKILWNEGNAVRATSGGTVVSSELPTATTYLEKGCPVRLNYSTGAINVVKSAKLYADAAVDAVVYQVEKNHFFKVGDFFTTFDADSVKAYAITEIDTTTNTTHDVITVGTSLGVALTAADVIIMVQVDAEDAVGGAGVLKYIPNGLIGDNVKIAGSPTGTPIIQALEIEQENLPYYVAPLHITKLNLYQTFMFV